MNSEQKSQEPNVENMDTATRRDFMKVTGIGAMGLAYSHPIIKTFRGGGDGLGNYSGGRPSDPSKPSEPSEPSDPNAGNKPWWAQFAQRTQA